VGVGVVFNAFLLKVFSVVLFSVVLKSSVLNVKEFSAECDLVLCVL
jgi:hypothetical protein